VLLTRIEPLDVGAARIEPDARPERKWRVLRQALRRVEVGNGELGRGERRHGCGEARRLR
jgi:hypothetical protein